MRVIYIAGPITGQANYLQNFLEAEQALLAKGWIVLNPTRLPAGLTESDYMDICLAMVRAAHAVYMLPGWDDSDGASCERLLAKKMNKAVFYHLNTIGQVAA